MKFIFNDGGKSESKYKRQRNDCAVRAFAIVLNKPYDEVHNLLAMGGRETGKATARDLWKGLIEHLGGFTKMSFPAVKGQPRMNLAEFCKKHTLGTYLVKISKHVTVVQDGCVLDTFEPRSTKCVYNAWRKE